MITTNVVVVGTMIVKLATLGGVGAIIIVAIEYFGNFSIGSVGRPNKKKEGDGDDTISTLRKRVRENAE